MIGWRQYGRAFLFGLGIWWTIRIADWMLLGSPDPTLTSWAYASVLGLFAIFVERQRSAA